MKKNAIRCFRRGNIFIMFLMMLMVISIPAIRLIPSQRMIMRREQEQGLNSSLSRFRSGIDLERTMGEFSPADTEYRELSENPTDTAKLQAYLQVLVDNNLLDDKDLYDPVVPPHRWGTAPGQIYWQVQVNLLASMDSFGIGSFEAGGSIDQGVFTPEGWVNRLDAMTGSATLSTDTPTAFSSDMDLYPNQNRFGKPLRNDGYSLRLASGT